MDNLSTLFEELRPSQARRRGFKALHPLHKAEGYGPKHLTRISFLVTIISVKKIEKVKAGNEASRPPARLREPGKV